MLSFLRSFGGGATNEESFHFARFTDSGVECQTDDNGTVDHKVKCITRIQGLNIISGFFSILK